jgi:alcohol dehydrogenase class IV
MYIPGVETLVPASPGATKAKISYGLDFPAACSKHVNETFQASKVFIIASGSLVKNTDCLERLETAIGKKNLAGKFVGLKPHTLWSEVLEITELARDASAECIVTLGAGSLTDGAKIVAFVSTKLLVCNTIAHS